MNRLLHNIMRVFARREKRLREGEKFVAHDIDEIVRAFSNYEDNPKYTEEVKNIKKFLDELDVTTIVTPVRKITDFITEDLIATSPSFLGELLPRYQRLDAEHKKITNTPQKSSGIMMKIIVIALMAVVIVVGLVYAMQEGVFDGIGEFIESMGTLGEGLSGLPSPTAGFDIPSATDYSDETIMERYPTPELLKAAINRGEIDYNNLSSFIKDLVDDVKDPEPMP